MNLGLEEVVTLRRSQQSNRGISATRWIDKMAHKQRAAGSSTVPQKTTMQNLFHFVLAFTILVAVTGGVSSLKVKTCDCTSPQYAGVLDFDRLRKCPARPGKLQYLPVIYELLVEKGDEKSFSGQACRVRKKMKVIKEGIFWYTDTTFHGRRKEIAPADCWAMVQTGKCGNHALKKTGKGWSYHTNPSGEGFWNSVITFTTPNCEVKEIALEQKCDTSRYQRYR